MSERVRDLMAGETEVWQVPAPPTAEVLRDGRARSLRGRRARLPVAVAASLAVVAVVAAGAGVARWAGQDGSQEPGPVTPTSTATTQPARSGIGVSGDAVGTHRFGSLRDEVLEDLSGRLGEPDLTVGPQQYVRIPGEDGWFESDDNVSPRWDHPLVAVSCWEAFCAVFGGADEAGLTLRGWELSSMRRWSGYDDVPPDGVDVWLAGTGVRLGDTWAELRTAYPQIRGGMGEGASVTVDNPPWPGIFDGVAGWRMTGFVADTSHPEDVDPASTLVRVSAGEGPEPGCC